MANCGADTEANALIIALTGDAEFPIPKPNLDGPDFQFPPGLLQNSPTPLTPKDITDGHVDGPGVFDVIMRGFKAHLQEEYDSGRITADDYTKAYIALTESAMGQGVAFLLGKDQAFWTALTAQVEAFKARVQLETTKVQLASVQYEASNQKAQYGLSKMQIAVQEVAYCTGKYNLENMLPKQMDNLIYQGEMLKEQTEAQRAQTLDVRKDGTPVVGVLGKQKDLYAQQITSYQRDAEVKAARFWTDAWITQKTIDEGLVAPNQFTNDRVNEVLVKIRNNNNLG